MIHSGQVAKRGDSQEYTADQIVQGIIAALQAGDVHAVPGLIQMLALRDPQRAQEVYDVLSLACNGDRAGAEKASSAAGSAEFGEPVMQGLAWPRCWPGMASRNGGQREPVE